MNFYISDLHLGHKNVLKLDNRPFKDITEMEEKIILNWNKVVTKQDTVYILGDFCWDKEKDWIRILSQLNGNKVLIKGNHDLKQYSAELKKYFQDIKDYKEIYDNGKKVIMCHYPMLFYRHDCDKNTIHLYGHVHNTDEEKHIQYIKQWIQENDNRNTGKNLCQFYNCWCGFYNYTPVTLEQIIQKWSK